MDLDVQDSRRPGHDLLELGLRVELEAVHGPEAVTERTAEQALACRGADAREMREGQRRRARPHSLAEHRVESKVLEGRIERLLHDRVQSVDLVDEEDVTGGEVQQDRAERALVVDRRTRADLDRHAQLVGNDVGERGFAESGRAAKQDVLDRLAAATGRLQQYAEVLAPLLLPDILGPPPPRTAWGD